VVIPGKEMERHVSAVDPEVEVPGDFGVADLGVGHAWAGTFTMVEPARSANAKAV
jgi:hypothetical protein